MNPLVRLVDDDNDFRSSQELFLGMCGFETIGYSSAAAFLEDIRPERPGCIVLDIRMPGLTGIDLQRILKERGVEIPIIFLTGHGTVETAVHTLKIGASDFIEKQGDRSHATSGGRAKSLRRVDSREQGTNGHGKAPSYFRRPHAP